MADEASKDLITLTADIVAAHVSHNIVATAEVAALIQTVHEALSTAAAPATPTTVDLTPAVPIRASVKPDHIVCLEDGAKLKMLKRYLARKHGMTPEQYRAKWGLPAHYPMVAPDYAEQRRALARTIGLGRKPKATETSAAVPKPRGRNPKLGLSL